MSLSRGFVASLVTLLACGLTACSGSGQPGLQPDETPSDAQVKPDSATSDPLTEREWRQAKAQERRQQAAWKRQQARDRQRFLEARRQLNVALKRNENRTEQLFLIIDSACGWRYGQSLGSERTPYPEVVDYMIGWSEKFFRLHDKAYREHFFDSAVIAFPRRLIDAMRKACPGTVLYDKPERVPDNPSLG